MEPPKPPPIQNPSPYPREEAHQVASQGLDLLVPIRVDGYALAAGYLGLLSCIVFPAPISLVIGIIALKRLNSHPDKTGKYRAWFGIVMGARCARRAPRWRRFKTELGRKLKTHEEAIPTRTTPAHS